MFATAIIAGTMGAKKTSDLIPFCHQIPLDACNISIELQHTEVLYALLQLSYFLGRYYFSRGDRGQNWRRNGSTRRC